MPISNNVNPAPAGATPIAAPPAAATGASARQSPIIAAQDKFPRPQGTPPLDYSAKYPTALVQRYPKIFLAGGDLVSHMELETKWKVDLNKVAEYKQKLDALAADPKLAEQMLGKGWSVVANTKYIGKPMVDNYSDDPATLGYTKASAVNRDRSVEGDRFNNKNFKPDGGIAGPTAFDPTIRIEYDIATDPAVRKDPSLLAGFVGSGEHFDVFRFGPKVDPSKLKIVSTISDVRAKYVFKHTSGLEIEASLDDVTWSSKQFTDDKGAPMKVRYAQLEMEKAHLAFAGNGTPGAATPALPSLNPGLPGAAAPPASANDPLAFLRNNGGAGLTFGGPPRIHTPEDAKDPSIRQSAEYKQQVDLNKAVAAFLYGSGVTPEFAKQKNRAGFEIAAEQYKSAALKKMLGIR